MTGSIDLDRYFARLGYDGPSGAGLRTLERLHALHAEKIPFENLSPFLGEPVRLDFVSLQDKLLERGRGGWWFEHNLLFSHGLMGLGFAVARLPAGRGWDGPANVGTLRSPMLILRKPVRGR